MDVEQIRTVGRALPRFLDEFSDCFGRRDTRAYFYSGAFSKPRVSILPIDPIVAYARRMDPFLASWLSLSGGQDHDQGKSARLCQ